MKGGSFEAVQEVIAVPTYVYEIVLENGQGGEQFEIFQRMSEEPLRVHPESGKPVRRVIQTPSIAGKFAPMNTERALKDDRKLERLGFTKYVKSDDGKYEKVLGKGPSQIGGAGTAE